MVITDQFYSLQNNLLQSSVFCMITLILLLLGGFLSSGVAGMVMNISCPVYYVLLI